MTSGMNDLEAEMTIQRSLGLGGFWMRPLVKYEEKLIIAEEKENRKLRTRALAYSPDRNLTSLLFQDIFEAYSHKQQVTAGFFGTQGFGKSEVMKAMVYQCQQTYLKVKGVEPEIYITFGMNDTFKLLNDMSGVAILCQDEDPFTSGTGASTAQNAMQNIQEIVMRFNDISFLYAAVNPKSGKMRRNINHWFLEPLAINIEQRTTFCILYSGRSFLELGHVILKILPETHELTALHSAREKAYKNRIWENRGLESVGLDPDELQRLSSLLLKFAVNKSELDFKKLTEEEILFFKIYTVESLKSVLQQNVEYFAGDENKQKRILNEAWAKITHIKQLIRLSEEKKRKKQKESRAKEKERQRKLKEQKKAQELLEKVELEQKIAREQHDLIASLVDPCIQELNLLVNKFDLHVVRHYFRKKGVLKQFFDHAIGEVKTVLLEYKMENIQKHIENKEQYYSESDTLTEKIWKVLAGIYPVEIQAIKRHDLDGESWTEIAKELKIPRSTLRDKLNRNRGEIARIMGELFEEFRFQELKAQFPGAVVQWGGKNSNEPDITVNLNDETLVYSLKCFIVTKDIGKRQIRIIDECQPEINASKEKFVLDVLEMVNARQYRFDIDKSQLTPDSQVLIPYNKDKTAELIY